MTSVLQAFLCSLCQLMPVPITTCIACIRCSSQRLPFKVRATPTPLLLYKTLRVRGWVNVASIPLIIRPVVKQLTKTRPNFLEHHRFLPFLPRRAKDQPHLPPLSDSSEATLQASDSGPSHRIFAALRLSPHRYSIRTLSQPLCIPTMQRLRSPAVAQPMFLKPQTITAIIARPTASSQVTRCRVKT